MSRGRSSSRSFRRQQRLQQVLSDLQPDRRGHRLDRLLARVVHQRLLVRNVFEYGYNYPSATTAYMCNSGMEGDTSCDEVLDYPQVSFNGDDFHALIASANYTTATAADIVDQIGLFSATDPGFELAGVRLVVGHGHAERAADPREHHLQRRLDRCGVPGLVQRRLPVDRSRSVHDAVYGRGLVRWSTEFIEFIRLSSSNSTRPIRATDTR